jgi:hypothetical protein
MYVGGYVYNNNNNNNNNPPLLYTVSQTTFAKWMELAVTQHNHTIELREHEYFRVSSDTPWLLAELPFFKPVKNLLLVDPKEQKGIHCR